MTVTLTLWQQEVDIADLNQMESILAGINLYPCKTETLEKKSIKLPFWKILLLGKWAFSYA